MPERNFFKSLLLLAGLLIAMPVLADSSLPGLWKTFDDDSGRESALVRIVGVQDRFDGRIEKLLDPDEPPNPLCKACSDERRNQPVIGMTILRHVRHSDSRADTWEGGDILDPDNGKVYRVTLTLTPDGRWLNVRAYIGTPMFGRTQKWQRVE